MAKHLERELERLKKLIYSLSACVSENLDMAVNAVQSRNEDMAVNVIEGDRTIDEMEIEVEEECLKILALYQPVAIDLRFIIAILKVDNELERIGDLAADIAKNGIYLKTLRISEVTIDIHKMMCLAKAIVHKSLDALLDFDADKAREVIRDDQVIDSMKAEMKAVIIDALEKEPFTARELITLLAVISRLERIGDHATNIAEDVIYLTESEIVRHQVVS